MINQTLQKESSSTYNLLSERGKRLYLPEGGIFEQLAESKEKATQYNAVIGIATDGKKPLIIPHLQTYFLGVPIEESVLYAPACGVLELRKIWLNRIKRLSPSLSQDVFTQHISNPIVTNGLTYGISICASLFFDTEDTLISSAPYWVNYDNIFIANKGIKKILTFDTFEKNSMGFNLQGLDSVLKEHLLKHDNAKILLNFPQNPSGYSLTKDEAENLKNILYSYANIGKDLLIICDDAYFGLYYQDNIFKESMFSLLANAHKRITAIKIDGISKELYAWGLRIGFITIGGKGLTPPSIKIIENKISCLIRSEVSNHSMVMQNILVNALQNPILKEQAEKNYTILKDRALEIKRILNTNDFTDEFVASPFNSGYFMLLNIKRMTSNDLRLHLLNKYQTGVFSIGNEWIRIAFSSVPKESLEGLFQTIYKACKDF